MNAAAALRALGLAPGVDVGAVRAAYADALRAMDPDADPDGFARLRRARDVALAAARGQASGGAEDDPFAAIAQPPAQAASIPAWPHAAPRIDHPVPPGGVATRLPAGALDPRSPITGQPASGPAPVPLVVDRPVFGFPRLDAAPPGDVLADRGRGAALHALLLDSGPLDVPLDPGQEARAQAHLQALIRMIGAMPLGQTEEAESWVADVLARAWPRSAPLVAPAVSAFGWASEHGQLHERPAVAFLNARLAGMCFVAEVEQRDHRWHKAWTELSRPGFKRGWGVSRSDVKTLLEGLRKDFPEVEQYLDPQRVGAWEAKLYPGTGLPARGWQTAIGEKRLWWLGTIFALQFIRAILDWHPAPPLPPVPPAITQPDPAVVALNGAVHDWFGQGFDLDQASRAAPLVVRIARGEAGGTFDPVVADRAMRTGVLAALTTRVPTADSTTLRAIQTLRGSILRDDDVVRSGQDCRMFLSRGQLADSVVLDPAQAAQARTLLARLAGQHAFDGDGTRPATSAMVPGAVIARVVHATGLTPAQVATAMAKDDGSRNRCLVQRALLHEALGLPVRTGDPILRTI